MSDGLNKLRKGMSPAAWLSWAEVVFQCDPGHMGVWLFLMRWAGMPAWQEPAAKKAAKKRKGKR